MAQATKQGGDNEAKRRILETVIGKLNAGEDIARLTTRQIAAEAEVNPALINYYYGGKEALVHTAVDICMEQTFNEIMRERRDEKTPAQRIRHMVKAISDLAFEHYDMMQIALARDVQCGSTELVDMLLPTLRELYGGAKTELELKILASQIVLPMQTMLLNANEFAAYFGEDLWNREDRNRHLDIMLDNLLAAPQKGEE